MLSPSGCRFFLHYAPYIPGVYDSSVSPDEYYGLSQFLFWSIVCTGARKYTKDPTIMERVARRIMNLALSSIYSISQPILAIQAVLLLCLWPLPISTMYKDPSHALAGAAMQLAIQQGLHVFGHEQDFARTQLWFADSDKIFRARLWINCLIVFQR